MWNITFCYWWMFGVLEPKRHVRPGRILYVSHHGELTLTRVRHVGCLHQWRCAGVRHWFTSIQCTEAMPIGQWASVRFVLIRTVVRKAIHLIRYGSRFHRTAIQWQFSAGCLNPSLRHPAVCLRVVVWEVKAIAIKVHQQHKINQISRTFTLTLWPEHLTSDII